MIFLKKGLVKRFYSGKNVLNYESSRKRSPKWGFEEESVQQILNSLPPPEIKTVADVPVGTNRFAAFMESSMAVERVFCADLSVDMLTQAIRSQTPKQVFSRHDIFESPPNFRCDTLISLRFLNLFPFDQAEKALANLAAVTDRNLIISVRLTDPHKPHDEFIENKIYIHEVYKFHQLINKVGFFIELEHHFPDKKGGNYFVLQLVRRREV